MSNQPPVVRYGEITKWHRDRVHPDPWSATIRIPGYPEGSSFDVRGSYIGGTCPPDWRERARVKITIEMLEPKTRVVPWRPEDVPLGAWFRYKRRTVGAVALISVEEGCVYLADGTSLAVDYNALATAYDVTTDGGKTWRPAGRVEEVLE